MKQTIGFRSVIRYNKSIGWLYVPNVYSRLETPRGENKVYVFQSNNQGFRSDFDFINKKKETRRIICLGDSHTAGDGVANCERFSDILNRELKDTESYNFALGGSGYTEHFLIYQKIASNYEHDIILYTPHIMDISRFGASRIVEDYFTGKLMRVPKANFIYKDRKLKLVNSPIPETRFIDNSNTQSSKNRKIDGRIPFFRRIIEFMDRHLSQNPKLPPFFREKALRISRHQSTYCHYNPKRYRWQLVQKIIRLLIQKSDNRIVILCPLPDERLGNHPNYQPLFSEIADNFSNVLFLDLMKSMKQLSREERWSLIFRKDNHLTIRGHKYVAKEIIKFISREGLI